MQVMLWRAALLNIAAKLKQMSSSTNEAFGHQLVLLLPAVSGGVYHCCWAKEFPPHHSSRKNPTVIKPWLVSCRPPVSHCHGSKKK